MGNLAVTITSCRAMSANISRCDGRATLKSTDTSDYYNTLYDHDQMQHSTGLPKGEWVLVATYFKTLKDPKDDAKILGTAHRFAVAQATVDVVYDAECECRVLEGDFANLTLKD